MNQWQGARCERVEVLTGAAAVYPIVELQQECSELKVMVQSWTVSVGTLISVSDAHIGKKNTGCCFRVCRVRI